MSSGITCFEACRLCHKPLGIRFRAEVSVAIFLCIECLGEICSAKDAFDQEMGGKSNIEMIPTEFGDMPKSTAARVAQAIGERDK